MAPTDALRVLLVEDDEDDFVLTRSMLQSQRRASFEVEWEQSYGSALHTIRTGEHDVYLVDYRLGDRTGLDLVREAWESDPPAPVIMLTGQDDYEVDLQATELGVTDYLVKGTLDAPGLERTIRYAVRQHQAIVELRRSEERYAVAVRATNDGIWDWDLRAGTMHFSERWKTLLGYPDFSSDQPDAWFELVHDDDVERLRREIEHHLAGGSPHFENEHRIRHGNGSWRWVLTRGLTTRDGDGTPIRITGSLSDITERRRAEERLIHHALHDSLTGLPNRALFMDRLVQCLGHLQRTPGNGCAVLYLDVDRFKLINDSLSHVAGDKLLVEVGRRVSHVLRPGDTIARLGGDEFAILLDGITALSQARDIAFRASGAIAEPTTLDGHELTLRASIGIAHSFDGGIHPEELIRNADIAMYDAKAQGGGRSEIFDTSMHQRVLDRVSLETRLNHAIEEETLRTFFQPIVDLRTGSLHGLEALARWPLGEAEVSPAQFIPVAEEAGLVGALGALILRRACRTLGTWREEGVVGPEVTVSVNVSIRQITDAGLVAQVRTALSEAGLPAVNLVLEITESTLIENPQLVRTVLRQLMHLGVGVQLDDFGTGYSSLTVLHDFPGDTLKIDRTFVDTMTERAESQAIIRSIVGLAHNLGLRVIAEGIEQPDQLQALIDLGCRYGQGYHFARPLPTEEIEALLAHGGMPGVDAAYALASRHPQLPGGA
ncbi:MAG TPA: EAL domain-containing protein [Solirubrobacteraceae bacterium]|jgi:diguanylate cyclase (GGDEF)-like protein/PAS domain S-box-containing protein|nr:EAL domain-containing protein [Solirubrobacteraceae bacterium]